jgi:hypothetical protein
MKTKKVIGHLVIILTFAAFMTMVCCEIENSYNQFWFMFGAWFFGIIIAIGWGMFIDWCFSDTKKSA